MGVTWKIIVKGFFAEANILDGYRARVSHELEESIDPKPTHLKPPNSLRKTLISQVSPHCEICEATCQFNHHHGHFPMQNLGIYPDNSVPYASFDCT